MSALEDSVDFFALLPSVKEYERDVSLEEAEKRGIHFCGDYTSQQVEVYKFLACEGVMVTYHRDGDVLRYQKTEALHPVE